MGYNALFTNNGDPSFAEGSYNCAFGAFALSDNSTGHYNSALGTSALEFNTTGEDNTATGYRALRGNTTGNFNTATGVNALFSNTRFHTALAMRFLTTRPHAMECSRFSTTSPASATPPSVRALGAIQLATVTQPSVLTRSVTTYCQRQYGHRHWALTNTTGRTRRSAPMPLSHHWQQ